MSSHKCHHHRRYPSSSSSDSGYFVPEVYLIATKTADVSTAVDTAGVIVLANDLIEWQKTAAESNTIHIIISGKFVQVCSTGRYQVTVDLYPVTIPAGTAISVVDETLTGYPDASVRTYATQTGLHASFLINATSGKQMGIYSNTLINSTRRLLATPSYLVASLKVQKIDTCHSG